MTIKKFSRNERFDDYEDRPSRPQQKNRVEKRLKNALRTNDIHSLSTLSEEEYGHGNTTYEEWEQDRYS